MATLIQEDLAIRTHIKKKLSRAGISRVEIERFGTQSGVGGKPQVRVIIHAARPGIIIGRGGTGIDALKKELDELTGKQVQLNVQEIHRPEVELRRPPRPSEPAPVGGAASGSDTDRTVVIPSKAPRPIVTRRDTDVTA